MPSRARRGRPPHDDLLTPSEWRTVHAVQHGMTNREIAERRGISIETSKFHVANALAKLQVGNRKGLRQWFRAPKHSALGNNALGNNALGIMSLDNKENSVADSLQLGPIGQISRTVRNVEEAQNWYATVLGIPHLFTFGKLAFFDCGGTRLMLTQEERPSSAESVIYLRVPDIVKAHDALRSRGVEFTNAPHMIHKHADGVEEWMAFFKDPEGRPLGIMSQVKP